jgi:hypothetical protein
MQFAFVANFGDPVFDKARDKVHDQGGLSSPEESDIEAPSEVRLVS